MSFVKNVALYIHLKKCFVNNATGRCKPKLCNHIPFCHHPQPTRRKPCSHQLLKEITLKVSLSIILESSTALTQ